MSRKTLVEPPGDPSPAVTTATAVKPPKPPKKPGALLTEPQAAAKLGVTASDLYQRRRRGDGPPFTRLKNRIFYIDSDLDDWIAALPRFRSSAEGYSAQALAGAALAKKEMQLRKIASGDAPGGRSALSARHGGAEAGESGKGRHEPS
jgi:predicted DNA-binding transcriptional regulator AlpA